MKNKFPCELIQDLFPSYIDGLTSEVTNNIVDEHVTECTDCKEMLKAMKEPSVQSLDTTDKKEIDFLKKTRKQTHRIVIGSVLFSIALIVVVLITRFYFVGNEIYSESIACEVQVDGNRLTLRGVVADESLGISSIDYTEENGVVTVSFKAVQESIFHRGEFESDYIASDKITQVRLDERIIWDHGESVSAIASAVFNTRHAYIGDMSKNGQTAKALNIANYLGNYKNELQTVKEPYEWKFIFEDEISVMSQERKEKDMHSFAYVLMAVIDNLGAVAYEYEINGVTHAVYVTQEDATAFAGADIKSFGQDVLHLQSLIQKTGLDTYAYLSEDSMWHTDRSIQLEIVNNTDAEISSIGVAYCLDGEVVGSQECANADGSILKKGAKLDFTFLPEDFGDVTWNDETEIIMKISVYDKDRNVHEVDSVVHLPTEFSSVYNYTLSGNVTEGFKVSQ